MTLLMLRGAIDEAWLHGVQCFCACTLSDTQSGKYRLHAGVAKLLYLAFSGTDVLLDAVWHQGMLYVVYM